MADKTWFWNMLARRYSRQAIGDEAAYHAKLEKTRKYFTPEAEVFEFGCGTGGTARLHAPFVKHIRATDFSQKMIAIAKERQADDGVSNVDFEIASIDQIGTYRTYDVVMGMSILHLLPDWREIIGNIYSMVKPGGVFVTSTVCLGRGPVILRALVLVLRPLGVLPSIQFFSDDELVAEMEHAGFAIEHRWRPKPDASVYLVARKA